MPLMMCKHVYENVYSNPCKYCGEESHETNWEEQHVLHKQWIADGKAVAQGWWSI